MNATTDNRCEKTGKSSAPFSPLLAAQARAGFCPLSCLASAVCPPLLSVPCPALVLYSVFLLSLFCAILSFFLKMISNLPLK
jgi:hypothetical protein